MVDVLDKSTLMARIDNDLEFLADTFELFNRDRFKLMSQMREAVSRRNNGALADAAYALSKRIGSQLLF